MAPSDDFPVSPAPPGTATLPGSAGDGSNGNGSAGNGHTGGNGHGGLPDGPRAAPRRPLPGPSTRPAMLVLGIILALFLLAFVVDAISSGGARPVAAPRSLATAKGAPLKAVPAGPLVRAIVSQGEPPSDIVNALAAPAGSTAVPSSTTNRGVESYDRSIRIVADASEQDVIAFYNAQMPALHWKRLSRGPQSGGDYQLLFQHPGSDGHEWELGVTVSPTQFLSGSSPAASAASRGTTAFTVRLFAESDQD
jgi:hypothetical protein